MTKASNEDNLVAVKESNQDSKDDVMEILVPFNNNSCLIKEHNCQTKIVNKSIVNKKCELIENETNFQEAHDEHQKKTYVTAIHIMQKMKQVFLKRETELSRIWVVKMC